LLFFLGECDGDVASVVAVGVVRDTDGDVLVMLLLTRVG
jgi:hypothetical protein